MMPWLEAASQELIDLAKSDPPGSGKIGGQLYQMASQLDQKRAASLVKLRTPVAHIRYWEFGEYAIYFRIDGDNAFTVLHIGKVTGAQRVLSHRVATGRA